MRSMFIVMIFIRIKLHTNRYEGYMKHAFILNHEHGTNIAFMSSASMHQLDALYGNKFYDLNEKNLYGSLMFETNFYSLSTTCR